MENKNNKKWLIWGLIGFTVILLVTAVVLFFQLKQPTPSPTPKPKPVASPQVPGIQETTAVEVCSLSFTIVASPSPSPSPGTSPSPSPQPIGCFDTCSSDADCEDDLRCMTVGSTKRCVNPSCDTDADCVCAEDLKTCWEKCQNDNDCESKWSCMTVPGTNDKRCVNSACASDSDCTCTEARVTTSPRPSPTPRAEQPALPTAGVNTPMVLGISTGILMMLVGLLWL